MPTTTKKQRKRRKPRPPQPPAAEALAHTINDFAARARLSRVTLYRMMKAHQLRFIKIRGRRRIPTSEYTRLGFLPAD